MTEKIFQPGTKVIIQGKIAGVILGSRKGTDFSRERVYRVVVDAEELAGRLIDCRREPGDWMEHFQDLMLFTPQVTVMEAEKDDIEEFLSDYDFNNYRNG